MKTDTEHRSRINIKSCARCGCDHDGLHCRPLTNPPDDCNMFAMCPKTLEPILINVVQTFDHGLSGDAAEIARFVGEKLVADVGAHIAEESSIEEDEILHGEVDVSFEWGLSGLVATGKRDGGFLHLRIDNEQLDQMSKGDGELKTTAEESARKLLRIAFMREQERVPIESFGNEVIYPPPRGGFTPHCGPC